MQTVSYREIRDLFGELTSNSAPDTNAQASFGRLFNRVMRRGWGFQFWHETMEFEERRYRDAWAAGNYDQDDEVYHAGTDAYYVALDAVTAADVPGVSANWEAMEMVDAYVGWEQTGQEVIGRFKEIWTANYRTTKPAWRLKFELDERGARLTEANVPPTVWVRWQRVCPSWVGGDFNAGAAYAAGTTRYFEGSEDSADAFYGDYWTTTGATTAGQTPITHPGLWEKLEIPALFTDFAANACKLGYNEGDGELDKALQAQGEAWAWLYDEIDKLQAQGAQFRRVGGGNVN